MMHRMGFRNLTRAGDAAAADMDAVTQARLCQGKRGRQRATAGVKTAKDRLTIAFICNVDSSETFRPMVISKVRRPRDFTNNRFDPEPYVYWRYNKRGWMTSEIFMAFIESLNAKFFAEERQVVLLVDNASSHRVDTESAVRRDILGFRTVKLSNIRVVYLPPNTTAFTQPLDQGVISAVKARFRQRVIADWLRRWDDRGSPASLQNLKPTVSETVIYLYKVWEEVKAEMIQRCWFHSSILPRSWRALMPLGSCWTSDPGDTIEELELLGRQLAALNLGPAGMSAAEFNSVDDMPQAPRPLGLSVPAATTPATAAAAATATAAPVCCTAMALLRVLAFDHEGIPVQFDMWLDDLQLYLLSDSKDSVSLFDLASGAAPAPLATADTQAMYDAVVARYFSLAIAALGRLLLPYLFPELSAFTTVEDLVSHLRTSDARYRATVPAEFLDRNQPPMFITLYFIVTCLPDSLRSIRDHFLSLDPTSLTVDLLEQHLLAAETSAVAVVKLISAMVYLGCSGCDSKDGLSLFDLTSGASTTPTADADSTVHSQWLMRDAVARLAVRNHLPSTERAHFSQYKSARALYDAVVARYSSPTTAALSRLMLPYLFLDLAAFATVADLVAHLRTSDARYRAALPTGFLPTNSPPMYITLYYLSHMSELGPATHLHRSTAGQALVHVTECATGGPVSCGPVGLAVGTPPPLVLYEPVASSQVFAAASRSSPAPAPCSCRPLAHETLLWHHRLGHPSLPRLRGMASRALVSGLPRSLPPLPPGPAPTCVPCVEGRQRAAPHSSSFPLTEAPLQTLHMDVWGPARVCGRGHERYFLLVVDDYSRYTTVFPLRSKGEVTEVLIDWIHGARRQLSESFGSDLPVLRLHSDRGGEFSCDLLRAFSRSEGIRQTFTLLASPQQNGIAERRIGMVMDVARTSMIHAAAPHFLWPFAVQYAAHQINLQPRVFLPETTPTLRWTGKVGDASAFCVWGSRAFVRDTTADKLSSRAVPCVFLGFPPDAPEWHFCHPTSRRVLSSQDVTFDESVDPAEPVEVAVDSGAARGDETGGAETGGAETGGAESGGALGVPSRREPLSPQRLREWYSRRCRGAAGVGAAGGATGATGGAGAAGGGDGAGAAGGAAGAGAAGGAAGAVGAGGATGATGGAGAAGGSAGAGAAGGAAGTGGPGAEGTGSVSAVSRGAARPWPYYVPLLQQVLGSPPSPGPPPPFLSPPPVESQSQLQPTPPLPGPSPYSGPTRGLTERREPESRLLSPASRSALPVRTVRAGCVSRPRLLPVLGTHSMTLRPSTASQRVPLPSPPASSLPDGPDPESDSLRAASPIVTRFLATAVTGPLFESSAAFALVAELVDFAAACRLDYATSLVAASASVCPPSVGEMASWKSTGAYVDEVPPPGANIVSGMWIFRVKRPPGSPPAFKARYVARGFSQRQGVDFFQTFSPTAKMTTLQVLLHVAAQRDYELHSLDFSTAFLQGSLHEEIWLRRPLGFTGSFPVSTQWSLRRPGYGLRQAPCEWHDTLRTTLAALGFAPSIADPSLFLRTDATMPPFYVLVYVDDLVFATADTEAFAHVKSELQKRHTCTDLGELTSYLGLRITRDRAQRTITLTQSHMVQQVLQRFGFTYSSPQSTLLPTGHSLSVPPSDESVEPSGPYSELVGYLMYLITCTRPDLAYPLSLLARYVAPGRHRKVHWDAAKRVLRYLCSTSGMGLVLGGRARVVLIGHADASWVDDLATQRSSQGYTFSLCSDSVSWRSTRSSSVLSSSCEAEIYAGAMAAQELRWLTYLLTDLGEVPRSPPVLYVNNKAMLALCQEQRLEQRTKHIALRYFLARELQQRGQLRLAYVASQANTADVFTKALQPSVGAAHGTPRPPFFEGCSPSPLAPSYASATAEDIPGAEDVGAASASAKRSSGKGKGSKGGGGGSGSGGGGSSGGGGGSRGGGGGGGVGGGGEGSSGSGGSGGSGTGGGGTGARRGGFGGGQRVRAGQTCRKLHTQHNCFSSLDNAWRAEFGDDVELPCWADLLRSRIAIFELDFDAILSAMYALFVCAEGDCYRCVPPDPGIAAAALSASESGTLPGTAPAQALHTFTLDSGASRCFFRDSTTLTPLPAPVPVRLANPSGGPVVARSSTVLPCPANLSSSLSGLHLPSISMNLVSTAALQDAMVTTTTCTWMGRHLATFTRRPGSSLYTLATEPPQVVASGQVSASGHVAASCSCRLLLHQTLLWHHRLGHPSLPRLRGMHSLLEY
ncbi:unnamed protein product [Closterium sp. NIES-54]